MSRFAAMFRTLRVKLAGEYGRARIFRAQGARIGEGCRLLVDTLGSEPYLVEIGDETLVTAGVRFVTHDGATWVFRDQVSGVNRFGPIRIGNRCFIGTNAILLPGTTIGDRSIVGAGSVVKGVVPPGVVVAGVPAKVICTTDEYRARAVAESLKLRKGTPEEKRIQLTEMLMEHESKAAVD